MSIIQTAERHSATLISDNVMHQRHMIAYFEASERIHGRVLEIGSGEGYGIAYLSPKTTEYHAIDKFPSRLEGTENVHFYQMAVPPLTNIQDNYFDFVVSFQVIEHINDGAFFLREIFRVLKPNGTLILTTPNREMSLTRNPWHVREYLSKEMEVLIKPIFESVEIKGVYGSEKVMDYYLQNKKNVAKITRFDIFDLQHKLPRKLLQIPYDILNRLNRNKLHKENASNVQNIQLVDFFVKNSTAECFDLFVVATKTKINN